LLAKGEQRACQREHTERGADDGQAPLGLRRDARSERAQELLATAERCLHGLFSSLIGTPKPLEGACSLDAYNVGAARG
jgi:hypothetical protein